MQLKFARRRQALYVQPVTDREGTVPFRVNGDTAETWYRIVGELRPQGPAPLVTLHGGPGATHDYLLSLTDLAEGRAVVFYDQLGNGRSTHYPERGAEFWTVELFVSELHNLVDALGIGERHHVLGQSWGGFLAQEYAFTSPHGLQSLVLADTAASFPDFVTECNRLRQQLPPEVSEAFAWLERDPTVYHTMNGPSEFHVVGSLKDWQSRDQLGEISVPTLLLSGRHDEATPALQETLEAGIPDCEWVVFEESSHMPHVEERERYMQILGDWLVRQEQLNT